MNMEILLGILLLVIVICLFAYHFWLMSKGEKTQSQNISFNHAMYNAVWDILLVQFTGEQSFENIQEKLELVHRYRAWATVLDDGVVSYHYLLVLQYIENELLNVRAKLAIEKTTEDYTKSLPKPFVELAEQLG